MAESLSAPLLSGWGDSPHPPLMAGGGGGGEPSTAGHWLGGILLALLGSSLEPIGEPPGPAVPFPFPSSSLPGA